jgi:uncharacterized protein with GYD domain
MYQFKYTPAAWTSFIKKPEDRGARVDELLRGLGGRLLSIYYTTGEWDGLVIYEAPDANIALAALIAIIAPGHIMESQTFHLYTMKDTLEALKTAGALKFRGMGGVLPSEAFT